MSGARALEYRWSWSLPAPAEALWPLVSDTNRFNRDAGLPPVEDARAPGEMLDNARRLLRLRVLGVVLEWEELPFEWVRPWRFGVVRRYARGPLREMRVLATLEPEDGGRTRLTYRVSAHPRGLVGRLVTPLQIGVLSRLQFGRVFKRYAASVRAGAPARVAVLSPVPVSGQRLARIRRRLVEEGVADELAERLVDHVATSDDMALVRIRPYELAELWSRPRREVLSACLYATRAGLLDLRWDVICPRCLGAKDSAQTLERLRAGIVHCDTCDVEFSRDFDQSVEISFAPNPSIRVVDAPPFCVAGPQVTPHVDVQQLVAAGETRSVSARLRPGRHRVRGWGVAGGPSLVVAEGGAASTRMRLTPAGWDDPSSDTVAPDVEVELVNEADDERLLVVERIEWADFAATGAEVTALAEFRDLFSREVLASGAFANVGTLAILFTDLKDSTRLYRRIGDAPAFGQVMRHFDVLEEAVRTHDGTIVKTIGDAVMAVFREPANAIRAVARAQQQLVEVGGEHGPLVLKAGLHFGPSIAVTLNERLDYFGTTVNVAARLGDLSGGGDLIVSDPVRLDPAVDRLFADTGAALTTLSVEVRGIEGTMRVWRVVFARPGAAA